MKKLFGLLALLPSLALAQAVGPGSPSHFISPSNATIGSYATFSTLPPVANYPAGVIAYVIADGVEAWSNGSAWTEFSSGGGSGTVTSFSVVSANGFAGTVATATTTPAATLTTSITGPLKGSSGALAAASNSDILALFPSSLIPTTDFSGVLQAAQEPAHTGDCTNTAGSLALTCLDTNGVAFGTFATANAATPPVIGNTTPAAITGTVVTATAGLVSTTTGADLLAVGNTGARPGSPVNGEVRYNSTFGVQEFYNNGTWRPAGGVVVVPGCNTNTANTFTGTTGQETSLFVCTIPAGLPGTNGTLRITTLWQSNNNADTKTFNIRLATSPCTLNAACTTGTLVQATGATTSTLTQAQTFVRNNNSASSQLSYSANGIAPFGQGTVSQTPAINTANVSYLNFNCSIATTTTDVCGIDGITVEAMLP